MSLLAIAISLTLHASVALALWPSPVEETRATERIIEVSVHMVEAPGERRLPAAFATKAAHRREPGTLGVISPAPEPVTEKTADASAPAADEPDLALILPSLEAPPPLTALDFATNAPAPPSDRSIIEMLPVIEVPVAVTGRELVASAASSARGNPSESAGVQTPGQPLSHPYLAARLSPATARPAERALEGYDRGYNRSNRKIQQDYVRHVVRHLSHSRFVMKVSDAGDGGVVVTRLTVGRDGRLLDLTLTLSSGADRVDRTVLETIQRAAPFPPLPADFAGDRYSFVVPIRYASIP